jgi:hypothetical protein
VIAYLSFGLLVVAVFSLGRACFSWRVGLLAAFVVATSYTVVSRTTAAYFDLPVVALMAVAAALEAQRPRRGAAVLALLAVAGLQRPEAWLLAGAYWLYVLPGLSPRQRMGLGALAASPALLWLLSDLAVTGDPLFSFVGTKEAAVEAASASEAQGEASRGVLAITSDGLRNILRLPVLAGAAGGAVIAALAFRSEARVPAAVTVLGLGAFVVLGFAGILLIDRFLFLPAAMLATFFALAGIGWVDGKDALASAGGERSWLGPAWVAAGIALLLAFAASLPSQADRFRDLRDGAEVRMEAVDDLDGLADLSAAGAALRSCPRVYVPNNQLIPLIAYAVERAPGDVLDAREETLGRGAFVVPTRRVLAANAFFLAHSSARFDPGNERFDPVQGNESWRVYARGCGPGD